MNYVFMPTPLFCHVWASFGTSFFSPMSCFGKPLIFLSYPMLCLPHIVRLIFHVTLRQVPDFSFLSDVMPAPCCPSSFRCHALAKKEGIIPPLSSLRGLEKPKQSGITFESLYKCFYKKRLSDWIASLCSQ